MQFHLIVREPFGGYAKGEKITDAAKVTEILAGENEHHVIKVVPDAVMSKSAD